MPFNKTEKPVSASEIGRVTYCPNAFALEHNGHKASKQAEKKRYQGEQGHKQFNRQQASHVKRPCFVATQTLGENHPITQSLRMYRDEYLSEGLIGRLFVRCYYLVSPHCIPMLKRSHRLNGLARWAVIAFHDKWVSK